MKKSYYSLFVLMVFVAIGMWSIAPRAEGSGEPDAKKEEKKEEKKSEAKAEDKEKKEEKVVRRTTSSCLVDELALEDLKTRRDELNQKKKELEDREKDLKAKEVALESEIKKLKEMKDELSVIQSSQNAASEEKVNKVVENFELMQPKAISQVLITMDESLAVNVLNKLSTQKVSKVMNIMDPARSSRLYELMAGVVRARGLASTKKSAPTSSDAAVTTENQKGGEK